ncbi:MAG: aspartate kinase, partial [Acidimicrobiia bacterium]
STVGHGCATLGRIRAQTPGQWFVLGASSIQTVGVMSVVVQKYGGSSVAEPSRIQAVADRVRDTRASGHKLVVVVSAMGQTTDRLVSLASEITSDPTPREMDMLLTAGERITMALLAMALHDRGIDAVSYTGSQAGILTDSSHGEARITQITAERVRESVSEGKVVIVAGFQGVDPDSREITTLGRGGSDTTAVALAASLDAEVCEILTDVGGVFSADPRVVSDARKLEAVSYEDMLVLAGGGASILMPHSVEHARANGVRVHVRSSFSDEPGTWVVAETPGREVVGIATDSEGGAGVITIVGSRAARVTSRVEDALSDSGIASSVLSTGDRFARLEVPIERIDDAVRSSHYELFGSEATP